jgi:hypothetical protein
MGNCFTLDRPQPNTEDIEQKDHLINDMNTEMLAMKVEKMANKRLQDHLINLISAREENLCAKEKQFKNLERDYQELKENCDMLAKLSERNRLKNLVLLTQNKELAKELNKQKILNASHMLH